jgi:spoIIIJ-associated protein
MEGDEKEFDQDHDQTLETDDVDQDTAQPVDEPGAVEMQTLEDFDKKRREAKIEYVQSLLEGILFRMGIDAKVATEEIGQDIRLEMRGDNSGLLIGRHGRTLDAIQYILNKVYQRRFGEGERVFVDTENYRKRRVEALENLAARLGEKVKRRRRAVVAGVFNSRDRRTIHMALRDDALLETESQGDGFYKKLVIRPSVPVDRGNNDEATQ